MSLEEFVKIAAEYAALVIEGIAILVIAAGAFQAGIQLLRRPTHRLQFGRKQVWQNFALWLILGLEFMLAADILRTVVSPTWEQLGQLASIAVIRTFLNYFLEKDLQEYAEAKQSEPA